MVFVLCIAMASVVLFFCSQLSPLYSLNQSKDVNIFATVGRELKAGKILYTDVADHKGPILFFLYYLFACLTETSFWPALILEIICLSLFLFFSYKLLNLYTDDKKLSVLGITLLPACLVTGGFFTYGGNVETIGAFMQMHTFYLLVKSIREKEPVKNLHVLLIGLYFGVAFWIKYTFCGFYMGCALFVIIWYLFVLEIPHNVKTLFQAIGYFLLGFLIVSLPVLCYFLIHNNFADMVQVYFTSNMTYYTIPEELSRPARFIRRCGAMFIRNVMFGALVLLSIVYFVKNRKEEKYTSLLLILSALVLTFSVFWFPPVVYIYYPQIFLPYATFGLIPLLKSKAIAGFKGKKSLVGWTALAFSAFFAISFFVCPNTKYIHYPTEKIPQLAWSELCDDSKDHPTMLCYQTLDRGFFFTFHARTVNRWFFRPNYDSAEILAEHNKVVENGFADFVVTSKRPIESYPVDASKYVLLRSGTFDSLEETETYYLYGLKQKYG